ncbi:hypothetical protein [Ornithinibacillus halophilus]|uniref:Uncharacterized protein n=1 Tax=Ornithinibacillus halophilus TaxID=930117 RepID=A0A1M5E9K7_9BACI|nr:hypothetical protein [Ornithinibacillus halophilus]SHF75897.1 hypothetical protein SAMN05216225_100427 [Ornithinibacillus halophilus]
MRLVSTSESREQINKSDLETVLEEQKKFYNLIKIELEMFNLENQYNKIATQNKETIDKIDRYEQEIDYYKSQLHRVSSEQQYYLKEYNKILESTSWKVMAPLRMIGSTFKGLTGRR